MIDVNLLVFIFFFPVLRKPPNDTRFSRREASASERSGRLDARVSQPVIGTTTLHHLKSLTNQFELGNFLPFQFLPNLLKASDGLG
jgi:hypothetical protein